MNWKMKRNSSDHRKYKPSNGLITCLHGVSIAIKLSVNVKLLMCFFNQVCAFYCCFLKGITQNLAVGLSP